MRTWFTSDQHFGHANIIGYCDRPFRDLTEMNREIVARYNACVESDDLVYHPGDFSLDERLVPEYLKQLNGKKILVPGNHDRCHPCHKRHEAATRRYLLYGFDSVTATLQLPINERYVTCCHLPYSDAGARFWCFRPEDKGEWLLHGHVHEMWKVREHMINVGVDQWDFYPVSEEEIAAIINWENQP